MHGKTMGKFEVNLLVGKSSKNVYSKEGDHGKKWMQGRIEIPINQDFKVNYNASIELGGS